MKGRGRWPARDYDPGERVAISWRITPELKQRLDKCAAASGRSLSQEIELRLEQSMQADTTLFLALDLACGPEKAGLVLLITLILQEAVSREAADCLGDPEIAVAMAAALARAIAAVLPETAEAVTDERRVRRYLRPLQQVRDHLNGALPQYPLYLLVDEIIARLSPRLRERLARLPPDISTAADAPDKGDFIISERPGPVSRG